MNVIQMVDDTREKTTLVSLSQKLIEYSLFINTLA